MSYMMLKHLHMTFALLSALGFLLRGIWMLMDSPLLRHKLTRILPHVIDTLLLVTAVALIIISHLYPFVVPWLTWKLLLVVVYIVLGVFALRGAKTKPVRTGLFVLNLGVLATIFWLAVAKPY